MLRLALIFLLIALVAGLFGFVPIYAGAMTIAKFLFALFLVLFIVSLLVGGTRGRPVV